MLQCHRLLLSNTLYFRDDHYRNILKTLRPSMNQMKMNTEFKDAMRALNSFVDEREQVLNTTLKWLVDGLNLSQSWIRLVPDNAVPAYLSFCKSPSPDGASNIVDDCINSVRRLAITEVADM
jgi:hypothetical protein